MKHLPGCIKQIAFKAVQWTLKMNFYLTKKLQKKLHLIGEEPPNVASGKFSCWYANVFTAYSRHYILTTHVPSCFSIVQYGGGITSADKYVNAFEDSLLAYLEKIGLAELYARAVSQESPSEALVYNTADKSILAVMNGMVRDMRWVLADAEYDPLYLTNRVNDFIHKTKDSPAYSQPLEAFSVLLGQEPKRKRRRPDLTLI